MTQPSCRSAALTQLIPLRRNVIGDGFDSNLLGTDMAPYAANSTALPSLVFVSFVNTPVKAVGPGGDRTVGIAFSPVDRESLAEGE